MSLPIPNLFLKQGYLYKPLFNINLFSSFTGVTYPIQIYLPKNISANKTYPVLYVLDAEWHFSKVADSLDELEIEAIIVGIENFVDASYKHRED
ncbi:hypothetical protein MTsN2n4_19580 [Pseudoalteromonas sp. MTN2-4]